MEYDIRGTVLFAGMTALCVAALMLWGWVSTPWMIINSLLAGVAGAALAWWVRPKPQHMQLPPPVSGLILGVPWIAIGYVSVFAVLWIDGRYAKVLVFVATMVLFGLLHTYLILRFNGLQLIKPRGYAPLPPHRRRQTQAALRVLLFVELLGAALYFKHDITPCHLLDLKRRSDGCVAHFELPTDVDALSYAQNVTLLAGITTDYPGTERISSVLLWSMPELQLQRTITFTTEFHAEKVLLSPDGSLVAVTLFRDSLFRERVRLWNTADGTPLSNLPDDLNGMIIAFSPDSRLLALGSQHHIQVWRIPEGELLYTLDSRYDVFFAPEGDILYTIEGDGIRRWNALDGTPLGTIALNLAEGQYVDLIQGDDLVLRSWDYQEQFAVGRLGAESHGPIINADGRFKNLLWQRQLSPDGRLLLLQDLGGDTVLVWSATTGELLKTIHLPPWSTEIAIFSPDGRHILIATYDELYVWEVPSP